MRQPMRVGCLALLILGWQTLASAQDGAKHNGRGAIGAICESQPNGSCRIRSVVKDGPANQAGLRTDDTLLRVRGETTGSVTEQIGKTTPGTHAIIEFQRGDDRKQIPVTIGDELALYSQAAEAGDPSAQTTLGEIYVWRHGVAKSATSGMNWLRKAADAGDSAAQTDLGNIYLNGQGVPRDDNTAAWWFRKAADRGYPNGEYSLAFMYTEGRGLPKDPKLA